MITEGELSGYTIGIPQLKQIDFSAEAVISTYLYHIHLQTHIDISDMILYLKNKTVRIITNIIVLSKLSQKY